MSDSLKLNDQKEEVAIQKSEQRNDANETVDIKVTSNVIETTDIKLGKEVEVTESKRSNNN
jgi:hypothetical protein